MLPGIGAAPLLPADAPDPAGGPRLPLAHKADQRPGYRGGALSGPGRVSALVAPPAPGASGCATCRCVPAGTPARLYSGALKNRQDVVAAVVNIDVGTRTCSSAPTPSSACGPSTGSATTPIKFTSTSLTGYDFWFSDYVAGRTFRVAGERSSACHPACRGAYPRRAGPLPHPGHLATPAPFRSAASCAPWPWRPCSPAMCSSTAARPATPCWLLDVAENPNDAPEIHAAGPELHARSRAFTCCATWTNPQPGAWVCREPRRSGGAYAGVEFQRAELGRF
ncbi:MAG: hypothetical protein WKG07_29225 [Hymenobacter sp.]